MSTCGRMAFTATFDSTTTKVTSTQNSHFFEVLSLRLIRLALENSNNVNRATQVSHSQRQTGFARLANTKRRRKYQQFNLLRAAQRRDHRI